MPAEYDRRSPSDADPSSSRPGPRPRGLLPRGVFTVLIVASLVWLGVVAVFGLGVALPSWPSTASGGSGGSSTVDYLYLTIAFNPQNGLDEYFPANFSVPVHATVIVTITNYDNGTNLVPAQYAQVVGTVGGTAQLTDPATGAVSTVSRVPLDTIAHTFTIASLGGSGGTAGPAVNVPIPAAVSAAQPSQVTFQLHFDSPGSFTWMCMAPCDAGSMATPGLMTGTLEVS